MGRWYETEVNIQGLARFIGASSDDFWAPFFAEPSALGQSPASCSTRFTVWGLA
ncbi:MAG: hypothetical protein AAF702_49410 [Chloroflexota bacterium]